MLREIRQQAVADQGQRRWFADQRMDLILWYDQQQLSGFQLCYDKQRGERALTWTASQGFRHNRVDDGENAPLSFKESPILVADGAFHPQAVAKEFERRAAELDAEIRDFVLQHIALYP